MADLLKPKPEMQNGISIIIPVAKNDETWKDILLQFDCVQELFEIIFIGPVFQNKSEDKNQGKIRFLHSRKNRAGKMNEGAILASNSQLFFLHADSLIPENCLKQIKSSLSKSPNSIHYFKLAFKDGSPVMRLNETGANFRSICLKMPFGDQGFFMTKNTFFSLGGYPENAPYGEDHLLIWKAHQNGVSVIANPNRIATSSRKYQNAGWLKTTAKHIFLTYQQAFPEMLKVLKGRKKQTAVAIFVKTPGFSSVKTRLAQTIGQKNAEDFFTLSLKATEEMVVTANTYLNGALKIYWAVSEPECLDHSRWSNFSVIGQGNGQLGDRLHHVYSGLIAKYKKVIMIGADLPHLSFKNLVDASLAESKNLMGKTDDGGFYLYAGSEQLSEQVWTTVNYSCETTASELIEKIGHSKFSFLNQNFDIDVVEDLKKLAEFDPENEELLPAQKEVIKWAKNLIIKLV